MRIPRELFDECQLSADDIRPAEAYVYKWTAFDGAKTTLRMSGCSAKDAQTQALKFGWTPPRWWQWWRHADYPTN